MQQDIVGCCFICVFTSIIPNKDLIISIFKWKHCLDMVGPSLGGALVLVCTTVSKKNYMCMAHIFSWLQLCHHPFFTGMVELFFPHHQKNRIVNHPQNSTFDSQMLSPQQSYSRSSHRPIFFTCVRCAAKWESGSTKKCSRPWWEGIQRIRFQRTNRTRWFWWFESCAAPWHYQGKVPRPSDRPATTSLRKKTPIFTPIVKCANLRIRTHREEK